MKKRLTSILLVLCMVLTMHTMTAIADAGTATSAHGRLADGGYNIYCMSGGYVTVDTYPSLRSVQLAFPDSTKKVFYVENKGNNQITLKVENSRSSTGYSYVGIEDSIKNGVALKLVDSPYIWSTYAESNNELVFSLRPSTNTKVFANASGESKAPRTKIILWSSSNMNAPKHGQFRFEPVANSVKTPVATDYKFTNLIQTEGSVTPVRIEASTGMSPGAVTILYNGSTTLPTKAGSYSVTFNVAAAPPSWKAASGLAAGTLVVAPKPSTAAPVGQSIKMGGIDWRVLDVQDGKALVLSDLLLELSTCEGGSFGTSVWANSSLRAYLNGDFYHKTFTQSEKDRIVSTLLVTSFNNGYSIANGTDTTDKVFLLSAEELNRYFDDDNARIAYVDRKAPAILNSLINNVKVNPYEGVWQPYSAWNWWLRTPTHDGEFLCVDINGEVKAYRNSYELGVRPAMWIKVEGGGFTPYQPLRFNTQPNYFTKEDMVLAIARDIIFVNAGDWVYKYGFPATGPGVSKAQTNVGETGNMPPGYLQWFHVFRMRCWGVLSFDYFDPLAEVTYGEFKDHLMKTMEWYKKYGAEGSKHFTLTKDILAIAEKRAGISNTSADAKPVKSEIQRLSREMLYWLEAANAGNSGVRLLESPTKTKYKVGEGFDITGLLVVTGPYGKETNINDKLTFTTSGVKLTPGRPFQTAGEKYIEVSYEGTKLLGYSVTVKK